MHSLAGLLTNDAELVVRPPFIAPHHTASLSSLVGGGSGMPTAGRHQLRAPRNPVHRRGARDASADAGHPAPAARVRVHRGAPFGRRGQVPGAIHAGACGQPLPLRAGRAQPDGICNCTPQVLARYRQRISGPIKDRIDIQRQILPAARGVADGESPESTADVAAAGASGPRPAGLPLPRAPAGSSTARSQGRSCAASSRSMPPATNCSKTSTPPAASRPAASTASSASPGPWPTWRAWTAHRRAHPPSLPTPHRRAPDRPRRHPPSQRNHRMTRPNLHPQLRRSTTVLQSAGHHRQAIAQDSLSPRLSTRPGSEATGAVDGRGSCRRGRQGTDSARAGLSRVVRARRSRRR